MAKVLVNETNLTNIANAIREKNGTNDTYKPSEMASAISNISVGEDVTEEVIIQEDLINVQDTIINDIMTALDEKAGGGVS